MFIPENKYIIKMDVGKTLKTMSKILFDTICDYVDRTWTPCVTVILIDSRAKLANWLIWIRAD